MDDFADPAVLKDNAHEQAQSRGGVTSSSTTESLSTSINVLAAFESMMRSVDEGLSPTESRERYMFVTKHQTSQEDYYALIESLPDRGQGIVSQFDNLNFQSYATYLTKPEAEKLKTEPIVAFVHRDLDSGVDDEWLDRKTDRDTDRVCGAIDTPTSQYAVTEAHPEHSIASGLALLHLAYSTVNLPYLNKRGADPPVLPSLNFPQHKPFVKLPQNVRLPYTLSTKRGTTKQQYYAFIKALPDKGSGTISDYELTPWQSYGTHLTTAEAEDLRKHPIVEWIVHDPPAQPDTSQITSTATKDDEDV